ncbi:MAG: hypothetical protein GVY29_03615 [Spirochaetes bacterium]|nr:hypothetical protein [Spirochaetota bacterium]
MIYALALLALYFLFVDLRMAQGERPGDFRYFLYVDLFLIAILSLHLLGSLIQRPAGPNELKRLHFILPQSFGVTIVIWSVLISAAEFELTGNVTTYVITVFAIAVLLLSRTLPLMVMYGASAAALSLSDQYVGRGPVNPFEEMPFLVGLLLVGFTVSRIVRHQYLTEFVARERLDAAKTELSNANAELREANRRLQDAQLQLIRQEKLASIGYLSAGIAHEINNPLGYLKSNFTTLLDRLERLELRLDRAESNNRSTQRERILDEVREMMADIDEAIERIATVVKSLVDFAKPQGTEEPGLCDVHEGIEKSLEIARNSYKYAAEIERDFGDLPPVECHRSELNQVFLSIIVNAAEAVASAHKSTGRRGTIRIRTRRDTETVICDIANDGPAIPESDRERIFEPFYTTKQSQRGAGLGLSLAREIVVDRHRGELELLESGEETTFRLRLPIRG